MLVVTESAGSGASYRVAVYQWRSGKPRQVYQLRWPEFARLNPVADATVQRTPVTLTKQFVGYRTKGTRPRGVTYDDDFRTYASSLGKGGQARFSETVTCAVATSPAGPVAWQLPTQTGMLSLAAINCKTRLAGKSGWQIRHMAWDRAITGDKRYFDRMDCESVYPMAEQIAGGGTRTWSSPWQQPLDVCTGR